VPHVKDMHRVPSNLEEHPISTAPLAVQELPNLPSYFLGLRGHWAAPRMRRESQHGLLERVEPSDRGSGTRWHSHW
jgi:hypothetical protein